MGVAVVCRKAVSARDMGEIKSRHPNAKVAKMLQLPRVSGSDTCMPVNPSAVRASFRPHAQGLPVCNEKHSWLD
jgi:hypothetical protein